MSIWVATLWMALVVTAAPAATPLDSTKTAAARPDSAAVMKLLERVRNAACPLPGLATGGQPDSSTLASLAANGVKTVLDLRAPEEFRGFDETATAAALGLRYVSVPVTPATLADSTFDAFRARMRSEVAESMFVHCASGNRVGAMLLPWLVLDRGWSAERALEAAEHIGMRSEELRTRALAYIASHSAGVKPPSASPSRSR